MKSRSCLAVLIALLLPALAHAQAFTVLGDGQSTCGQYVAAPPQQQEMYLDWLTGFISGANFNDSGQRRVIGGWERESLKIWLVNFCTRRPLDEFVLAAVCFR